MIEKGECTGCSACFAICSHDAIVMLPNEGGFLYPKIIEDECVNCGRCDKVCELANSKAINHYKGLVALRHRDKDVVCSSTSGGAFRLFADSIIEKGGIVYGAAYDVDFSVHHIRCESLHEVKRLQKSKYVQSDLHLIYEDLAKDLKSGKFVLFTGTACQCSGVQSFAEHRKLDLSNLLTCDVICHGVPSPKVWLDYLDFRRAKDGEFLSVDFRNKEKGWRDFRMSITNTSGKKKTYRQNEDYFMILFFHDYILRESCYQCKFSTIKRKADITLGDFWGLEEFYPKFDDDFGTSVLMLNTDRGKAFFENVNGKCNYISIKEEELTKRQPNLKRPSHKNSSYDKFWKDYQIGGFEKAIKKYADYTILGQFKRQYLFKFLYYTGVFPILLRVKNKF